MNLPGTGPMTETTIAIGKILVGFYSDMRDQEQNPDDKEGDCKKAVLLIMAINDLEKVVGKEVDARLADYGFK